MKKGCERGSDFVDGERASERDLSPHHLFIILPRAQYHHFTCVAINKYLTEYEMDLNTPILNCIYLYATLIVHKICAFELTAVNNNT